MSLRVRSPRDAAQPIPIQCQPYRYGKRPEFEYPLSSPPSPLDIGLECDGGALGVCQPCTLSQPTAPLVLSAPSSTPQCTDPLLLHCPRPPFDCWSAGICLLTAVPAQPSADGSYSSPLYTRDTTHAVISPREPAACSEDCDDNELVVESGERAAKETIDQFSEAVVLCSIDSLIVSSTRIGATELDQLSPPAPPTAAAVTITSAAAGSAAATAERISRGRDSRHEYRRVGRGSLPPPPWPFFSRSSSYERTSWTSLSAAAAVNRTDSNTRSQMLPAQSAQRHGTLIKRMRVRCDGVVNAVLSFAVRSRLSPQLSQQPQLVVSARVSTVECLRARAQVVIEVSMSTALADQKGQRSPVNDPRSLRRRARDEKQRTAAKR